METFLMVVLFLVTVIGAAFSNIVSDEFKAWQPSIVRGLIARAVALMPNEDQERWSEEWTAYCSEIPGTISQIVAALGLVSAAWKVSNPNFGALTTKRTIDLTTSVVSILIAAPVLAITAILIRAESAGPILIRHRLVGANGRVFYALRFRTHTIVEGRPRATAVGHLIRRVAVDHLPMLFNVAKGDMSLVGPLPRSERSAELFTKVDPEASAALNRTRPGLVPVHEEMFARETASVEALQKRLARERAYADRPSVLTDLKLLWRVVLLTMTGRL